MSISIKHILEQNMPQQTVNPPQPAAAAPAAKTAGTEQSPQQSPRDTDDKNIYNAKFDLDDFESRISRSTESFKTNFQTKILSKIQNKQVQIRASKGYGQPEKDYIVNVSGVSIDFYYEKYVVVIKGREQNKQKESEFFLKPPYLIKIMGPAAVSKAKKQPVSPIKLPATSAKPNIATRGI